MREGGGQHERHRQPEHGVPRQRHHVVPSQPRREHDESGVRGVLFYPFYPPTSAPLAVTLSSDLDLQLESSSRVGCTSITFIFAFKCS